MWSSCMLSQLRELDMCIGDVCPAGSLPAVYSALRNLTTLYVSSNALTGMLDVLYLSAAVR